MTSQEFLYMTAGIGAAILALFLIRAKPKAPTRLKLRSDTFNALSSSSQTAARGGELKNPLEPGGGRAKGKGFAQTLSSEVESLQSVSPREKNLNVLFNYNGHTWDAYEVLGLPAGASLDQVRVAYEKECSKVSPDSREFLTTAFRSIESKSRSG